MSGWLEYQHHRIDRLVRHGSVGAPAVHGDPHRISGREDGTRRGTDGSRLGGHDVLGKRNVRPRDSGGQAVVEHCPGPRRCLLRRLEQDNVGATPSVPVAGKVPCRAEQGHHMQVVAAGVHDARDGGGEGRPGGLSNRQGIHVRPRQHAGTGAVGEDAHDAGPPEAPDVEARADQVVRCGGGRFVFGEAQLRMPVELLVQRNLPGKFLPDAVLKAGHEVHSGTPPGRRRRPFFGHSRPGPPAAPRPAGIAHPRPGRPVRQSARACGPP